MSFWQTVGNAADPFHIVYKPDAPEDANRDAAIKASQDAEGTAITDAQQKMAQIYGGSLPNLTMGTGLAADQARLRQQQVVGAANEAQKWQPGTFDTTFAPSDVYLNTTGQTAATQARAAQLAAQQQDLQGVLAAQRGAGPSVAAAQQAAGLDAARRQAGLVAGAGRGGNSALAVRGALQQNMAPGVAVQAAQARGQELATMRGQAGQGLANVFGNTLGVDKSAQDQQQLRNQVELANRQGLVRQAGLASDAFGQSVRDYKVGGALTRTADNAKLNAYDQSMQDQENAFASYQDYLQQLYGTGLQTAIAGGQRAAGTLDSILGARRQQDAANAGLVSSLVGGVMGAVSKQGTGSGDPNAAG